MSTHHPLPPHVHLTEPQPISSDVALASIESYLKLTTEHAYLHPDVIFTSAGPAANSSLATGGLVLHQLRRVEAGLRGEYIEIELADLERMRSRSNTPVAGLEDVEMTGSKAMPESNDDRLDAMIARSRIDDVGGNVESAQNGEVEANYQDQLREGGVRDTIGEIGNRTNYVGEVDHLPRVKSTKPGQESPNQSRKRTYDDSQGGPTDKASRKKAKKARMAEEKIQRQNERNAGRGTEAIDEATGEITDLGGGQGDPLTRNVVDNDDDADQMAYQGDEMPQRTTGNGMPDTPNVLRANVTNSALNGEENSNIVQIGEDGKPAKKKKKKSRKSEALSEVDKMDVDTELARDNVDKLSKVQSMTGRTPVKDDAITEPPPPPATSPPPGANDGETPAKKSKRNEKKREKKRKSEMPA